MACCAMSTWGTFSRAHAAMSAVMVKSSGIRVARAVRAPLGGTREAGGPSLYVSASASASGIGSHAPRIASSVRGLCDLVSPSLPHRTAAALRPDSDRFAESASISSLVRLCPV